MRAIYGSRFKDFMNQCGGIGGLVRPDLSLNYIFDLIYNEYNTVFKEKGLVGVFRHRNYFINKIYNLEIDLERMSREGR